MLRSRWLVVGSLAFLTCGFATFTNAEDKIAGKGDIPFQKDQQRRVKTDTDRTVAEVDGMLGVLRYYRLDARSESKVLNDVAGTLDGLSREQMIEVLNKLDAAFKAKDETGTEKELDEAYIRHRDILDKLKGLLAKYDAVKNLEQAAKRLDEAAKNQLELGLKTDQLIREIRDNPPRDRRTYSAQRGEQQLQADSQSDLRRDVSNVLRQVDDLREHLPADQKERVRKTEELAHQQRTLEAMQETANRLRDPRRLLNDTPKMQAKNAGDLQEMARNLRNQASKLTALREARKKVEEAMKEQEAIREQAKAQPNEPGRAPDDKDAKKALNELGDRQTRLQHETRDTKNILKPHAQEQANKLNNVQDKMNEAQEMLRQNQTAKATEPQKKATERLDEVKKDLDKLIAEAEKKTQDPLSALKEAKDNLEKLIQDQKDTQNQTMQAEANRQPNRLPEVAKKQDALAKRTEEMKSDPATGRQETQKALDKANKAMDEAAKSLEDMKAPQAVAKQDQAIKALEEAKKQLGDRMAEIEKRREEIAKLENAAKKLEELAKKETQVAEQARDKGEKMNPDASAKQNGEKGDKPDMAKNDPRVQDATKQLAKEQADITPQTKEVAKNLEKAAPEASKQVADSTKNMDAAKGQIEKNQLPQAAKNADDAAQKLMDAKDQLAKALDQKKAMEAAEQAAMQPETVQLANAARQVAKALEQTEQAAEQSKKSSEAMKDAQANLAQKQQALADQAAKQNMPNASKPADQAAKEMQKGDLPSAIQQQKKALGELMDAAKAQENVSPRPAGERSPQQLAQAQKELMEATQALAKSQANNQGAQAALNQAQAQAPQAVQSPLQKAGEQLGKANESLQQGQPMPANQAQNQAAGQLQQALQTLNQALAAAGQQPVQPGQQPNAQASQQPGQQPGEQPGQQPGEQQAQNNQSQEKNEQKGQGDRTPDGRLKNAESELANVKGEGMFIHLPPRQREVIRQSLNDKLPPEYAPFIQQYYQNIARGKPATTPNTEPVNPKR